MVEKREFTFFGYKMETVSMIYGLLLIFWAVMISFLSGSQSTTSWIPGIIGFPIAVFGYLSAIRPLQKKVFMHIVASLGVIACLGGTHFFSGISSTSRLFSNPYADSSKLMLLLSGGLFVYLCIRSFVFARQQRENDPMSNRESTGVS